MYIKKDLSTEHKINTPVDLCIEEMSQKYDHLTLNGQLLSVLTEIKIYV
jgi:hypothetical protein